jgi:hypothetical protein
MTLDLGLIGRQSAGLSADLADRDSVLFAATVPLGHDSWGTNNGP